MAELVNRVAVPDKDVDTYAEAEGWAKDRIRELQELRKSTGLDVSDRIKVVMSVPLQRHDWAHAHQDLIAREILATRFELAEPADGVEIGDGVKGPSRRCGGKSRGRWGIWLPLREWSPVAPLQSPYSCGSAAPPMGGAPSARR